ncbi:MAG TPA: RHS repeat-associated core domain-containing protein, partial [Sedimentisphaerales bacterium]|nr:RHS repeat-associated core domain-containing protein [Sedimentisphaerales bacterium]
DSALRLAQVNEPLLAGDNDMIVAFDYDENGNRDKLYYSKDGTDTSTVYIDYSYDKDNLLTGFTTTGGLTYSLSNVTVDGIGRLRSASETLTDTASQSKTYNLSYTYDMLSQLTDVVITNVNGNPWAADYKYKKDGNIDSRTVTGISETSFQFDGDLMGQATGGENFTLYWDDNGNMTDTASSTVSYNWDNKLRQATNSGKTIKIKYDPDGNRVYKESIDGSTTKRKYIIDILGELPTILMELDPDSSLAIEKTYIYANNEVVAQHDGDTSDARYFYLHDRLGSVRQIINTAGNVVNRYTYNPYGETFATEQTETVGNSFKFTGQWFDAEIDQYYLRARMYDPHLGRFTTRDPVRGGFKEPMSLHAYLYCLNDPMNKIDLSGEEFTLSGLLSGMSLRGSIMAGSMDAAFSVLNSINDGDSFGDAIWDAGKSFGTGMVSSFFSFGVIGNSIQGNPAVKGIISEAVGSIFKSGLSLGADLIEVGIRDQDMDWGSWFTNAMTNLALDSFSGGVLRSKAAKGADMNDKLYNWKSDLSEQTKQKMSELSEKEYKMIDLFFKLVGRTKDQLM